MKALLAPLAELADYEEIIKNGNLYNDGCCSIKWLWWRKFEN